MKKEILDQFEKHIEDIKNTNFLDDEEKMKDFKAMSKEDFLKSYSYITPEEYDNTAKLLAKNEADEDDDYDVDYPDEILALAQFLDVEPSSITPTDWNSHEYEVGEDEENYPDSFLVFKNYEDAIEEAKESISSLFDDIGVMHINWGYLGGIQRFLDEDWFKEAHLESNRFYAEDIASSEPERFAEEAEEYGLDLSQYNYDKETGDYEDSYLIDDFAEAMREATDDDDIQWYIDNFGEDDLNSLLKEKPYLIDEDALIEEIINVDGVANELARYDGKENEEIYDGVTYYIYRTN